MAGQDRAAPPRLSAGSHELPLGEEPWRYDLFAALRRIEAMSATTPRLGEGRRAQDEQLRLGQPPFVRFPAAQIAAYRQAEGGRPARLASYVMGLFGPQGPLPLHLTNHARDRLRREGDSTFADFCDVFHHRMIAFFYRAWASARPTVGQDRPETDRFARRLGALAGAAEPSHVESQGVPERLTLYAAGLMVMQTRPPEALARVVMLFFRVPARVEEFVGAWLDIPPRERSRLGSARLGVDAVAGIRSYQRAHRFRLVLGPLGLQAFRRFLPDGGALPVLKAIAAFSAGLDRDFDVQLLLTREAVPTACLDGATRLGWTSWLATRERLRDADDLVLHTSTA
jgi:type VI secretion system protein ImpH